MILKKLYRPLLESKNREEREKPPKKRGRPAKNTVKPEKEHTA
jgi:hypothetical protein